MLQDEATGHPDDAARPESSRETLRSEQAPGPPPPRELARHFPRLDIVQLVGQGGMGYVYKARQKGLDRLVALKLLPREVSADRNFAERFAREARALARLSHPGIVAVHDSGEVSGLYYFIMEYVEGLNLRELLNRSNGRVETEQALRIVGCVCDALEYAHEEGVVHRDIKPENILLDAKGRVKIADFGLAKLLGADGGGRTSLTLGSPHRLLGTPHYMAPEQTERPLEVDHRADIYSLGVVFYEMLTGELPLGRFPLPSERGHGDPRLDGIVVRALEKDPGRRFQRASDIRSAMASAVSGAGATPMSPAGFSSGTHAIVDMRVAMRRVRIPSILLVAAAVASLVLGAFTGLTAVKLTMGVLMIVGGLEMLRLRGRRFVLIICILALVPVWQWALLVTVPMGIWCLIVLSRADVAAAFRAVAAERAAARQRS